MGSPHVLSRVAPCALLVLSIAGLTGCRVRAAAPLRADHLEARMSLVASAGGPPAVRAAIVRALGEARYTIHYEAGPRILASYRRGRHYLEVSIDYDASAFHITPVELTGMNERHFDRYASSLQQRIQEQLAIDERRARAPAIIAAAPGVVYVESGGWLASRSTCESMVTAHGYTTTMHCRPDTDPICADALLAAGHSTLYLSACSRVEPTCARDWLLAGGAPIALSRCRY